MSEKNKFHLNILLNVLILVAIAAVSYAWMLTIPSVGHLVEYQRDLIVTSSDIDVDSYVLIDGDYVLQTESPMLTGLFEPGRVRNYRFDITNNEDVRSSVRVVLSNITGDVEDLKDYFIFGTTSPQTIEIVMGDKLVYTGDGKYMVFVESLSIPGNETVSLYWYAVIDNLAPNEIMEMSLEIEQAVFIRP